MSVLKTIPFFVVSFSIAFSTLAKNIPAAKERKLYVGSNSTEAILEFKGLVEYVSSKGTAPQAPTMKKLVLEQIEYMIGPMSLTEITAVPKGDHVISNIKVVKNEGKKFFIEYNYKGTAVVENGPKNSYDLVLPINPRTIYEKSFVGDISPCTDDHYQSEGDFWYFWSPEREGCKLKAGVDYNIVKAKMTRIENTKSSYPEYHNLVDENGKITIHVLFGLDDPEKGRNPLKSSDINADNYRIFRNYLLKNGFKAKTWKESEVKAIAKRLDGATPFVETLSKGAIEYRFFFGPSGIDEDALGFHWFYKDAIENASIMVYGGHSGLGGHLDLDSIEYNLGEPIVFNKKRYQIFFFDSCTSYKYYNTNYFERKASSSDLAGTKKLDIFTNGLSTYFHVMPDSNAALAKAIDKAVTLAETGKGFVSYQTLAKEIDSDNLFGVNGDEDNEAPKAFKVK